MARSRVVALALLACLNPACGGSGGGYTTTSTGGGSSPPASAVLTATPLGPSRISLSWTDPSAGTSPLSVGSSVFRNGVWLADTPGFSYVDATVDPGTMYSYDVLVTATYWFISYTTTGWDSNTVVVTTTSDVTPPSVPANVQVLALSSSSLRVTWDASTDDVRVSDYRVFRDGNAVATCTSTSYDDTSLAASSVHTYTVTARDPSGNESAASAPAEGKTLLDGTVVEESAANNSMAVDSAGAPHLVYVKNSAAGIELRHATNGTGTWTIETIATQWGYPSVAVDATDKLHVATHEAYLTNSSGAWVLEPLETGSVLPSIALDPSGAPHVAYLLQTSVLVPGGVAMDYSVHYADRGDGSWTPETLEDLSWFSPHPLLGWGGGLPHVAYSREDFSNNPALVHAFRGGDGWAFETVADPMSASSMAVTPAGGVHLAAGTIYATNASGSWAFETFDPAAQNATIAMDPTGAPGIAYQAVDPDTGSNVLKLAIRGAGGWVRTTVAVVPGTASMLALAFDAAGGIHISYCDGRVVYLKVK